MSRKFEIDPLTAEFLRVVDLFQAESKIGPTALSIRMFGKGSRLDEIRAGERRLTLQTASECLSYLRAEWPVWSKKPWPGTFLLPTGRAIAAPRVEKPARYRQTA